MIPQLAVFDMDGTLIDGRLVFALAEKFGLADRVREIQKGMPGMTQTQEIAKLFRGLTAADVESAVESIPMMKNCEMTISKLKESGCKTGIISDSYTVACQKVADRLQMDFVAANNLELKNNKTTGRVTMPMGWEQIGCFCKISICKRFHLEKFAGRYQIPIANTMAVGDTKSDICMVKRAGIGIAFMPKDKEIAAASRNIVQEPDLAKVIEFAV